jgi:hypothetical protein
MLADRLISGLCGWMLRSYHPRSTVEGTNMCAKGTNVQLCVKPKKQNQNQKPKLIFKSKNSRAKSKLKL